MQSLISQGQDLCRDVCHQELTENLLEILPHKISFLKYQAQWQTWICEEFEERFANRNLPLEDCPDDLECPHSDGEPEGRKRREFSGEYKFKYLRWVTPISRELPTSYRPYATLFNQVVSAQLQRNPALLTDSRFASFTPLGSPLAWLPQLRDTLTEYRLHEQQQIQQERRDVWQSWVRDTWALNSKKIYQLAKGKSVEPFTCLQHQGHIVTDRSQIDRLLQAAWTPIFARYPEGEDKATDYHTTFSLVPGTQPSCSFPRLSLEDFHFVLCKKLKANTATGLDGWRPHEELCASGIFYPFTTL